VEIDCMMNERLVDPFALVTYLMSDYDGSQGMAIAIKRAMLRALPENHPMVDQIAADLQAGFRPDLNVFRQYLVEQWKSILH
jgi:hypothetical protein